MSRSQPQANPAVAETLNSVFGFPSLREGQGEVVDILLAGRSSLAVFPTGGGKSLCYQLPALLLDGLTVVISPLIALMKDQVDFLVRKGVAAAKMDSTLDANGVADLTRALRAGEVKLLYIAPERLVSAKFRSLLEELPIALLAVDEAHCISEWGHNFRPDYLKVAQLARDLKVPRVLALTATATPGVSKDICEAFAITAEDHIQTSFRRSNLHYAVTRCTADERRHILLERLADPKVLPAIVYVTLQQSAEVAATFLQKKGGLKARAYHAGLSAEVRSEAQDDFMSGKTDIIVATIAFGMGIDKSDIRSVFHYNLPKTIENYAQETGRAGRDGEPSHCELLACGDDLAVLENFVYGDTPGDRPLRSVIEHVFGQGQDIEISQYELAGSFDIRPLVLATALTYLEMEGYISAQGMVYRELKLKFERDESRVIAGYDAKRKAFLEAIFATCKSGWMWKTLHPAEAAEAIGDTEDRVRRAITHLEDAGDIVVKPSGVRHRYQLIKKPESKTDLLKKLSTLFAGREAGDIERINNVIRYATGGGCHVQFLLEYFGESMPKPCGECAGCKNKDTGGELPTTPAREISEEDATAVQELLAERKTALRTARQLTRFLCGISSPAAQRAKLPRHDAFALLEGMPYVDVYAYAASLLPE